MVEGSSRKSRKGGRRSSRRDKNMANGTKKQGSGPVVATTQGAQAQGTAPVQGQGRGRKIGPEGKMVARNVSFTERTLERLQKAVEQANVNSPYAEVTEASFISRATQREIELVLGAG